MAALPSTREALETYLGFLETSGSTTEKESRVTPHIDRVLQSHRQRRRAPERVREVGRRQKERQQEGGASWSKDDYEPRLMQLETQLSQLLQKTKTAQRRAKCAEKPHPPEGSTSASSESCDEHRTPSPEAITSSPVSRQPRVTCDEGRGEPRETGDKGRRCQKRRGDKKKLPERKSDRVIWDGNGRRRQKKEAMVDEKTDRDVKDGRVGTRQSVQVVREGNQGGGGGGEIEKVSSIQQDHLKKTQLLQDTQKQQDDSQKNTQLKLVSRQLEEECERRAKAEKAAARLVEHVRTLQTQLEESARERELAVVRTSKQEGELKAERERGVAREEEGHRVQESLTAAQRELETARERLAEREGTLRENEDEMNRMEVEYRAEKMELLGLVRAAELESAGHNKEKEILELSLKETKRQLQQMQELLATRERDHIKSLQNLKPLDGAEVQERVRCEVERERERVKEVIEQHKVRLIEQQKAYQSLEDEFRMALHIEATRYQELRERYEGVQGQVDSYRETAEAALKKDQKATHMVAELSAIVREQRGRLSELSRARHDSVKELKERVSELECEVREKHKMEIKLQSLIEENSTLSSQLAAQQSVAEGLREERQLWGQELAQQGAELAQDRGRMEAQIESLTSETASLREDLQQARDSVRVKDKVVADQQSSIIQLREALAEREREGEEVRQDWEHEQQSIQLQLEQEQESSAHLQDELEAAVERKGQLKEELASVRDDLGQWKDKYSKLRGEWEERVKLITSLEESLSQVQATYTQREGELVREKEGAKERARQAEERLREGEGTHQQQSEAQRVSHDSHMTQLAQRKDREIQAANRKVREVEVEMREMLAEVAKEKTAMDARAQRLSLALHQMQQYLTSN